MARPKNTSINLVIKKRLLFIFGLIFTLMLLLIIRLGWIQIVQGPELQKLAVEQWTNEVKIDAKRGKILDRNGNELAISASCERVDAYMRDIIAEQEKNPNIKNEIAAKLSGILGDGEDAILKKLNMTLSNGKPINSVTIKRRIEKSQADEIRKLKLPGIILSEDSKRYYPNGSFLSHVLGFTNIDGVGQEGIEKKYDKELSGKPGRIIMETDLYRRELPYNISKYYEPIEGQDVVLAIDESLQLYVEKALEDALVENKAKGVTAIVMNPKTGEILAMANKDDYNPNDPRNMKDYKDFKDVIKSWNNKAVTMTYEPGSIFKVVTASAALSEGLVNDNDRFTCNGSLTIGGRRIKCWKTSGHGTQNFAEILQNSCNVGFMILGDKLGKEKLYKYIDMFGFGKPTNLDVPFEESGYVRPINQIGPVELSNITFGQGITVTPMQMLTTISTIANDGKMMEPHLVKKIQSTDKDGNVTTVDEIEPKMVKQVLDENVAKMMKEYLEKVVSVGGGANAAVDGYRIGGKTGTAQKAENGRYAPGKYVSSFIGFAPVEDPQLAIFICIDEPNPNKYYAGQIVAPLAGRIFRDAFTSLNIKPQNGGKYDIEVILPSVIGLTKVEAEKRLKDAGFQCEIKDEGKVVVDMNPLPGISVKSGSKVALYMGEGGTYNNKVIIPDLHGKSAKDADTILKSLGLKLKSSGDGYATSQSPGVGEKVPKGTAVSVQFEAFGD